MECITVTCNPKEQKGVSNVKRWVGEKRGRWEDEVSIAAFHLLKKNNCFLRLHTCERVEQRHFLNHSEILLVCVFAHVYPGSGKYYKIIFSG